MKVVKVSGRIKVNSSEVDKQPTIQIMLGGTATVTLDDGRVFTSEITWDDAPQFNDSSLTESENDEITEQITEYLEEAAETLAKRMSELACKVEKDL